MGTTPKSPAGYSLRAKWTAALVLMAIVPIAVLGIYVLRVQKEGLEGVERGLEAAIVDEASEVLLGRLHQAEEATFRVGERLVDERVVSGTNDPTKDAELRTVLAREVLSTTPDLAYVDIFDEKRSFVDAVAKKEAPAPSAHEFPPANVLDRGNTRWLILRKDLVFVTPLRPPGEPVDTKSAPWWLVGHLPITRVQAVLLSISEARFGPLGSRLGAPVRALLCDDNLSVIASDAEGAVPPRALLDALNLGTGDRKTNLVKAAEYVDQDQRKMIGTVKTIPTKGWFVLVFRSQAEAYAALELARKGVVLSVFVSAFLAALVGVVLARRTTDPIARLVSLTEAYAARDFKKRSDVKTGDEVEGLGRSLEGMADALLLSEEEIARRARVEANLSRYLPKEVAADIASGKGTLNLDGERREITIVFADVVGFTSFSENATPDEVVKFLNELFSILSEVVFRHGGLVDKFIGDSIMALFGAADQAPDHSERAIRAALDLHRFVESMAPAWKKAYGIEVALGIGIARGEALVGNLGSKDRVEFTAIGDTVNIAARLEATARPTQTLVTASVVSACKSPEEFEFKSLGEQPMRGKAKGVEIFELVDG